MENDKEKERKWGLVDIQRMMTNASALGELRECHATIELRHDYHPHNGTFFRIDVYIARNKEWTFFEDFRQLNKFLWRQFLLFRKF